MDHQSKYENIWNINYFCTERKVFLDSLAAGEEFTDKELLDELAVKRHRL
jgi:hypothetical protein